MADAQGFPQIGAALVDAGGKITAPWHQLLISLWKRTGSGQGGSLFSAGDLKSIAAPTVPTGWLLCDGSAVSRIDFAALFAAIGTTWGPGDGATTFNIPNLEGRMLAGAGGAIAVGDTGGAAHVNLIVGQLPAHNHAVNDPGHTHPFTANPHTHIVTDPGHIHAITDPGHHHTEVTAVAAANAGAAAGGAVPGAANTGDAATGITINNHVTGITNQNTNVTGTTDAEPTGITTANTGAGADIPTLPPFAAVYHIIKT